MTLWPFSRHEHERILSVGCPYETGAQWPDTAFSRTEQSQYPDRGQLTDGHTASTAVKDPGWTGFLRQGGRFVRIDLGGLRHVTSVEIGCLQSGPAGILPPVCVFVYASQDGQAWHRVGRECEHATWYLEPPQRRQFVIAANVNARFVRIQITARVYVFLDECTVRGQEQPAAQSQAMQGPALTDLVGNGFLVDLEALDMTELVPDGFTSTDRNNQAQASGRGIASFGETAHDITHGAWLQSSDEHAGGIHHMLLIYSGSADANSAWVQGDFLPLLQYEPSESGTAAPLFDSFLFTPHGKLETSAVAWVQWLDDLFAKGRQLHALDADAAAMAAERPIRVVLALPGTISSPRDFGQLDSTEPHLHFDPAATGQSDAVIDKRRALAWLVHSLASRFRLQGFAHLELAGLYWQPESQNLKDPYDEWLIREIAETVHGHGLRLYWIPFYGAAGITHAHALGFDAVLIQPGAAFHWEIDAPSRLQAAARQAQYYNMGIEIEMHWDIIHPSDAGRRATALALYKEYLSEASRCGYDGEVCKAYYANAKTLLQAARSPVPALREAYELTARFILDSGGHQDACSERL